MQSQQPDNQKNLLLAIILSVSVLLAWQLFYAGPRVQEEQQRQQRVKDEQKQAGEAPGGPTPAPGATTPGPQATAPGVAPPVSVAQSREAAISASPRVAVETASLRGSIALKGGRIDDLVLLRYHETVDRRSPNVVLFSPAEAPEPYFAEFGWTVPAGSSTPVPDRDTVWTAETTAPLSPTTPVVLVWDNGQGVVFRRTISIDDTYMVTVADEVVNTSGAELRLHPYGRIFREGIPRIEGFYIQHEGLIGVLGETGLHELTYSDVQKEGGSRSFENVTGGWLGFTDKYWASALIPEQMVTYRANLRGLQKKSATTRDTFQADFIREPLVVPAGGKAEVTSRLFAGAKRVADVSEYQSRYNILKFELLIDWGWFYFITKPLYHLIDWLYRIFGNFGIAILLVTVIVKAAFFPLANKSYESMAKMKKLQPEMERLRERYKDDRARQQQELMTLYKNEKINPLAGCLPILLQIPVFFALYKVLFISIDMRHAPFFGWIKDLSAPDPTSIFNLFGLMPWPAFESYLLGHTIGAWAVVMGITMWLQMQLNPQQPDPTQQMIFNWMPPVFTVLLSGFASGLVIYWAWNNVLSISQQYLIMKRQGVDVPLLANLKRTFAPVARKVGRSRDTKS